MCKVLSVSRSAYYAWLKTPESISHKQNKKLLHHIRVVYRQNRGVYGSPRIHRALALQGVSCGRNRVARLMREDGLKAKTKKRYKATTDSKHNFPVAPNLLQRDFLPESPDQVWAGDITYIWTTEGWLYLAVVIDLYSRSVVGEAMDKQMTRQLVINAMTMAIQRRHPSKGLIFHSDRGSQYASRDYQNLLAKHGISSSMSRKGDCWDNAPVESFFGSLKQEMIFFQRYKSRLQARKDIFDYSERFYNRRRLHSTLGYLSPADYEAANFKLVA